MSDETGWLIESLLSVNGYPRWWGKTIEGLGWTKESLDAVRFSRKEDAEMIIADHGWTEVIATEHMWYAGEGAEGR